VALKFFTTEADITRALNDAMKFTGLSSIEVEQAQMGPFPEEYYEQKERAAAATAVPNTNQPPPEATASDAEAGRLDQWIQSLVGRVSTINFKAVSAVGVLALIYAAISMLVEIERAFNQIYRVPTGRSWARRITQYWTLLTLGSIGLAATFYVGERFTAWLSRVAKLGAEGNDQALSIIALGYLTTVTISTAMLLLAYTVVPNTRVQLRPALAGALLAALLWEAGKLGFQQYLLYAKGYAKLYGSIALIPLFMLWVYVTWLVVLVGLQFSYYLQHGRHATVAQPVESFEPAIVDPGSSLGLMAALARRFELGKPVQPVELAAEVSIQEPIVKQLLSRLAEEGLALRVTVGEKDAFSLARPPDRISADAVLAIGEELANPSGKPLTEIAQSLRQARQDLVGGKTLADMMALHPRPVPPPAPDTPPAQARPSVA
jgi:membrane protein